MLLRPSRPVAAAFASLALLASSACGEEEAAEFVDFCTEVAMVDCARDARPLSQCDPRTIASECDVLLDEGGWDAVSCSPPTEVEADNCLNRLSQFGGATPFESVPPCGELCPYGFF